MRGGRSNEKTKRAELQTDQNQTKEPMEKETGEKDVLGPTQLAIENMTSLALVAKRIRTRGDGVEQHQKPHQTAPDRNPGISAHHQRSDKGSG